MAKKELLREQLTHFETEYRRDCVLARQAACPLVIKFCDASADGKSFSEATVDISVGDGFHLACFQLIGSGKLLSYLEGKQVKEAVLTVEVSRLEDFIADSKFFWS